MTMLNYVKILEENPNGVLATQENGKVKSRVFQYLFAEENKIYFGTNTEKKVYAQLQENPYASFCTYPVDYAPVVSVSGKVVFSDNMELKTRALAENPPLKGMYEVPENPALALFYIDVEEVKTFSFAEGPNTYIV